MAARAKVLALHQKSVGSPSEAQLSLINGYTLRPFAADELVVREYQLAHNCIDRDRECFDEALLQDFARTLPGKGVFIRHPGGWDGDSGPGEGRVFQASLETMSLEAARSLLREPALALPPDRATVTVLKASAYFARTDANAALFTKMDAGIVSDVSIGFNATDRERIKQGDVEINVWRYTGPGEALEMSHVWLGAQPGARATKALNPQSPEERTMDPKDSQAADALKAAQPKAAQIDALKAALGDDAALADDAVALATLVQAGKAHRGDLVDTIVKAERLAGAVADTDEAVAAAKKDYAALPLRALKMLAEKARQALPGSQPGITGGDPNAAKTQHGTADTTKAATPAVFAHMN